MRKLKWGRGENAEKTRTFDRDFLRDELGLPGNCIDRRLLDHGRWSLHYQGTFEYEDKCYQVCWSQGATESQDESPWEYEEKVEATEVVRRSVIVEKWVPVEA